MPLSKYKIRVRPLLGDPAKESTGIQASGRKSRACEIGILKPSQTRKAKRYRARTRYVEAPAYISGGSTVHPQVGEALGHHPDEPKVAGRSAKKGIGRCMCNIITHTLTCTMSHPSSMPACILYISPCRQHTGLLMFKKKKPRRTPCSEKYTPMSWVEAWIMDSMYAYMAGEHVVCIV